MDRFTKTTEGELSNVNMVEEEAPKKSRASKIVAIIVSFVLAVSAWLYVINDSTGEMEFTNIKVTVLDETEKFNIVADDVSVTLCGTYGQLVEIDPSKIIVKVKALPQRKGDVTRYCAYSEEVYYDGNIEIDDGVELSVKEKVIKVWINLKEKAEK